MDRVTYYHTYIDSFGITHTVECELHEHRDMYDRYTFEYLYVILCEGNLVRENEVQKGGIPNCLQCALLKYV